MELVTLLTAFHSLLPPVHGHGFVTNPAARLPGPAMMAACGNQVTMNQEFDRYNNIQSELQNAFGQFDYNPARCDIWLCKGYKFADNKDNVYTYSAGQTVDFTADILALHTGVANVSVVDTASNAAIGRPLIYWPVYASTLTGVTSDETDFSVTIPDDLGGRCSRAGDCVLQWYWYAQADYQTFESCVDFTVSESGSRSSSSFPSGPLSSRNSQRSTLTRVPTLATNSDPAGVLVPTTLGGGRQSSVPSAQTQDSSTFSSTPASIYGRSQDALDWVLSVLKSLVNSWCFPWM